MNRVLKDLARGATILYREKRIPGRVLRTYYDFLNALGRRTVQITTSEGLHITMFTHCFSIFVEIWQKREYNFDGFEFSLGSTVVDIGANQGLFSLYAAKDGATVYAFEPCVENVEILRENLRANDLADRVRVIECAVTAREDTANLFVGTDRKGDIVSGTVSIMNGNRGGVGVVQRTVPAVPINDLFDRFNLKRCDLLKMDCEGAEYALVESISMPNLRKVDRIAIEFHSGRSRDISGKLEQCGFELVREDAGEAGLIKAVRKGLADDAATRAEPH